MPVQGYEFKVQEKKSRCPFNPAHQVTDMQKHLTKCSSYNKDVSVKKCPFNATHWVKVPEFQYHLDQCPDKMLVDRHVLALRAANSRDGATGDLSLPLSWRARSERVENSVDGWDQTEDDWDTEVDNLPKHLRRKFDPSAAIEDREVFRRPDQHMGKSERNKFRNQMASQLQALQNGSTAGGSEAASSTVAQSASSVLQQRRRPTTNPICCQNMAVNPNMSAGRGGGGSGRPVKVPGGVAEAAESAAVAGVRLGLQEVRLLGAGRGAGAGRGRGAPAVLTPGVTIGAARSSASDNSNNSASNSGSSQ